MAALEDSVAFNSGLGVSLCCALKPCICSRADSAHTFSRRLSDGEHGLGYPAHHMAHVDIVSFIFICDVSAHLS